MAKVHFPAMANRRKIFANSNDPLSRCCLFLRQIQISISTAENLHGFRPNFKNFPFSPTHTHSPKCHGIYGIYMFLEQISGKIFPLYIFAAALFQPTTAQKCHGIRIYSILSRISKIFPPFSSTISCLLLRIIFIIINSSSNNLSRQ